MSETSTTASNFEPDFEAAAIHIEKWALELLGSEKAVASARNIYADCQRQAAAAGLVMVRREDLNIAMQWGNSAPMLLGCDLVAWHNFRHALATTPKPALGGDG